MAAGPSGERLSVASVWDAGAGASRPPSPSPSQPVLLQFQPARRSVVYPAGIVTTGGGTLPIIPGLQSDAEQHWRPRQPSPAPPASPTSPAVAPGSSSSSRDRLVGR